MLKIRYGEKRYLEGSVCYSLYFYIREDIFVVHYFHDGPYRKRNFLKKPIKSFLITQKPLIIWLVENDIVPTIESESRELWNFSKDEIKTVINKLDGLSSELKKSLLKALY